MAKIFKDFPVLRIISLRGMVIDFTEISDDNKTITIHLNRDKRFTVSLCSECGEPAPRERRKRRPIRDLPFCDKDVILDCEHYVVRCPRCGQRREKLDFADKCSRMTHRFESLIFSLTSMTTIQNTADKFELSWDTVKDIDKKYLAGKLAGLGYGDLKILSIDEIANHRGHDYLTIVMNLLTGRVIWVGQGRKEENLDEFFATLTQEQKNGIEAVSIDMWPAFINSVKKNCPHADIVFDKFHIIKKYGEVITKLRSAEYRKAETAKDKSVLKGTKWLLLKNKSNLDKDARKQLDELLELNESLSSAYILKEDLSHLWDYKNRGSAKKYLDNWIAMAESSGVRGIKSFTKMLRKHEYGILNHCRHHIDNGKIEGTNNKIKTLKRNAYGFNDLEYFKLKIMWTCRGKEK
jgi:transposase